MITKPKVGLFFGGPSREREISYKGGKTAFQFLDKSLFEPVLIFVDSIGNFIEIDTENMEADSIRDFYPSKNHNQGFKIYIESLGKQNPNQLYKLIYKIGKQIKVEDLKDKIDIAFPVMHGPYAEDGAIQGLLEWLGIPYVGPNVLASAIGINKPFQNDLLAKATGQKKKTKIITKKEWENGDRSALFSQITKHLGFPFVIKSPHQGSSIGIGIVRKRSMEEFSKKMHQCFFETIIYQKDWSKLTSRQKGNILDKLTNLNEGIGFPVVMNDTVYHHPADIQKPIDLALKNADEVMLCSVHAEEYVLIEEFIEGQEFSMGLIQDDDFNVFALPATEIYGDIESFDFKSKYQSNVTKKRIPIDTHLENLRQIENYGIKAFKELGMNVICRIDGFLTKEDQVIWHDPNTLPGMSPSSLIFKQLAEIGFTISQSITYLIRQSINQRTLEGKNTFALKQLLQKLDSAIVEGKKLPKKKVAVIFGEEEDEYLAAQTKYNELSSSEVFVPTPICAAKNGNYYIIPVNLMFKANILDFGQSIGSGTHPFVQTLIDKTEHIRKHYCDQVNFTVKKILESELQQNFDSIIRMGANG